MVSLPISTTNPLSFMENENENAQVDVVEQEEQTSVNPNEETQEGVITVSKKEFTKLKRKAIAYDSVDKVDKKQINNQNTIKPSDILKADEFKLYRQGYSEREIDIIMHNGGAKILEDKDNPIVIGLNATQQQRRAEDMASRAGGSSQLSEVEQKYTPEQLANMSSEELKKVLPHA